MKPRFVKVNATCLGKAVGSGVLNVNEIIEASEYAGTEWIIVEQDGPEKGWTPMESAAESARYILEDSVYDK